MRGLCSEMTGSSVTFMQSTLFCPGSSVRPRSFSIFSTYSAISSSQAGSRRSRCVENRAQEIHSSTLSLRRAFTGEKKNQPVAASVSRASAKHFVNRACRSSLVRACGCVAAYDAESVTMWGVTRGPQAASRPNSLTFCR